MSPRILSCASVLVLSVFGVQSAGASTAKPNVIYILADDLGFGDLGCYGQTKFQTPNIDKLADDGLRFTQHYSGSAVCAPSRVALLTGLHTGHCAVRGNSEVVPEGQAPMPADTRTLAHLFQKAGYATGLFGKWGLGAPGSASEPLKMGFDRFYGYNCQRQAHYYYPYFLWRDNQREMLWDNFGLEQGCYAPDLIQKEALSFIEQNRSRPFFLYYAMIQPHADMAAPESYMEKYRGKFLPESSFEGVDDGAEFRRSGLYASQPEARAAFAAMVHHMDDDVGELLAKIEELGLASNTLVIFSSDNGPHREGGHDPDFFNSSGGLRGYKRDLYEGGIRTPMIASWPGVIPAGTVTDQLCAMWDILPTLAEVIGEDVPTKVDGLSLVPTLTGKPGQKQHEWLYWEFHEEKGRVALRQGNWKAVRYKVAVDSRSPLELYDLAADPAESTNVAAQHPDVVKRMDEIIQNARVASPIEDFNFPLNPKTLHRQKVIKKNSKS